MRSFSDLLKFYMERSGISDAELARAIGVRRQTIFRWKEGSVARPRSREDVLALGGKLRLSAGEQDELLIGAGFHPEGEITPAVGPPAVGPLAVGPPAVGPPAVGQPSNSPDPAQDVPLRATLFQGPSPQGFPALAETAEAASTSGQGMTRLRWLTFGLSALLMLALGGAVWWAQGDPLPVAVPGETLVVVGQFTNFTGGEIGFNVAGRIADPLRQEIEDAGLVAVRVVVWPDPIRSQAEAQSALARSAAWMVIWGEYDSGRVLARFTQNEAATAPPPVESLIASPDGLFATVNSDLPKEVRYLALLTLGAFYGENNDYPKARAVLLRAYGSPPQERDAATTLLFRLGLAHQLGADPQPAQAIRFYTELLAVAPDHLLARYNRGLAHLALNTRRDWDQAIADFDQTLQRSPDFLAARIGRGVVYLYRRAAGDDERALTDFAYVIERDDQRVMAFYNRGLLAIRRDERGLWEKDLQQTIELAPDYADGYSALCWGYVLEAEAATAAKALPICDQAVGLGAQEALHSRAIAYAQLGDLAQAALDLRAFLRWAEAQPAASPYRGLTGQVQGWLTEMAAGRNPITGDVLAALRNE